MLRSNGRYFDFNGDIEVEKRVKLFEEIESTMGDFSYAFELPRTSNNFSIFGFPVLDAVKAIYKSVPCDILDDDGIPIYTGQIRLERTSRNTLTCSFFSGNYNWISLLSGPIVSTDEEIGLDFSELDTELTDLNIANSWDNTNGIIFPIIDTGALATRSYQSLMLEDFTGCIYVKYIFKKIFQSVGIKLSGDFFTSPPYDAMILCRNTKSQDDIDARSFFAEATVDQTYMVNTFTGFGGGPIIFDDDSTFPFFDGSQNNYNAVTGEYTADIKMRGRFEIQIPSIILLPSAGVYNVYIELRINGTPFGNSYHVESSAGTISPSPISITTTLEAGDVVYAAIVVTNLDSVGAPGVTINDGGTFRFTPVYIFFTSGNSLLPNWSKAEFVNNIFALFCCICDYDPFSKTLTVDFFDKIKTKEPVDISAETVVDEYDYQEFISSFAKRNKLSYQASEVEQVVGYNTAEFVNYGAAEILVDNDFVEDTADIVSSDFSAPISYINPSFATSLERVKFVSLSDISTENFDTVSDSSGMARFNGLDDTLYRVGDLVRVSGSTNSLYNGEYVISATGSGFVTLQGLTFNTDATGQITRLVHEITTDDSVYIMWQTQYDVESVSKFSRLTNYLLEENLYPNVAYAYFNMLNVGREFNNNYLQSLSFGPVNNPLSYQKTLVDTYWRTVGRILNEPVKALCTSNLNRNKFNTLTPLRPIRLNTVDTDSLYYLNVISGYKNSYISCGVELIKIS